MKFYINYNTGVGEYVEGTLEDAKKVAEDGLSYTQEQVDIYDEDGNAVARLPWCGVEPEEDDTVIARFGNFGFYGEWINNY